MIILCFFPCLFSFSLFRCITHLKWANHELTDKKGLFFFNAVHVHNISWSDNWLWALSSRQKIYLITACPIKTWETLKRGQNGCQIWGMERRAVKSCLLDKSWLLYTWTWSSSVWLPKTRPWSSQLTNKMF